MLQEYALVIAVLLEYVLLLPLLLLPPLHALNFPTKYELLLLRLLDALLLLLLLCA